jgi:F-type H+-transporting ATPase subunit b
MEQEHTTMTETTGAEAHGSGGLPQLQFEHWAGQIVWLLLIFAVLFVVLSKILLPKVGGTIKGRADKIAGDIADARRLKDEAEAQAAAAQGELAQARANAQKTAAEAKAKAQAEADARQAKEDAVLAEKLGEADARIKASRDAAMSNVRAVASETAQAITEKLTGKAATAAEIDAALVKAG